MGVYINPTTGTKEEYLWDNSIEITLEEAKSFEFSSEEAEHTSVVILINNGPFTAAVVMYDKREQEEFLTSDDKRKKAYYKIDKDLLTCPESGIPEDHHVHLDIRV